MDVAQLMECLSCVPKVLGSSPAVHKSGMVVNTWNPSTWEAETVGW